VDSALGDPVSQVRELTGGYGASAIIVAVGSMPAAESGVTPSGRTPPERSPGCA
jgi:threonine dehydrogenase-like Zn-dependent dehydrogenase